MEIWKNGKIVPYSLIKKKKKHLRLEDCNIHIYEITIKIVKKIELRLYVERPKNQDQNYFVRVFGKMKLR